MKHTYSYITSLLLPILFGTAQVGLYNFYSMQN